MYLLLFRNCSNNNHDNIRIFVLFLEETQNYKILGELVAMDVYGAYRKTVRDLNQRLDRDIDSVISTLAASLGDDFSKINSFGVYGGWQVGGVLVGGTAFVTVIADKK